MTALISSAQAASIRTALGAFLTHSAVLTPVTAGAVDAHGDETTTLGAPLTVACKYRPNDRVRTDEGGTVFVQRPTLKVAASTALATGDLIQNIRNAQNVLLAAGPLTVGRCLNSDGFGVRLQHRYELLAGDPMRAE